VRRLLLVAVVLGAAALAPAAAARVTYCSPTGDFCTSAAKVSGVRYLRVTSFAFKGRVRICVRYRKGGPVCHSFRLTKSGPAYGSTSAGGGITPTTVPARTASPSSSARSNSAPL
jgi:hypothetical protein